MEKLARLKVKRFRDRNNFNQEKIAKVLNVSVQTYCNKESGKNEFRLSEMHTLAKFYNTSLDELFWEDEELESDKGIV
ncbi:helix-turn-helix transcriptional regulator [Staphylococcus arlettae]|uniref:helix-turn-helix transcriptional regulator n=1 Tax=Staphylococcus arlettae TaxID=29378 RepID=UPI0021CF6672|nr:helix-turn-helix domain-containing protein [Staphylococcus arlettae]UXU48940.1 helix-turn-helix domain-containing protein [Staphylococcus arlettae]